MVFLPWLLFIVVWGFYKGKDLDRKQMERRENFDWEKASEVYKKLGGDK
jgi:hypothetical protein